MSQTISLCIFCREENAFLTKMTLNSMVKCFPDTWSEILVIDLFFHRKDMKSLPQAKFYRMDRREAGLLKFAGQKSRGDWLFLLEAGEFANPGGKFYRELLTQKKYQTYYIPLSSEDEDGWQPAFSPRLLNKNTVLHHGIPEKQAAFLCTPFCIARKKGLASFDIPFNPLIKTQEGVWSPAANYLLAEKACREKNYKKAAETFSRAYLATSDQSLKRFFSYKKMSCLLKNGQTGSTLQQLAKAEKHFSSPVEFIYLKGLALLKVRRFHEALLIFEQAAAVLKKAADPPPWGPENFAIATGKARALAALQQLNRSLDTCIHALACCPGYYPALRMLAKTALQCYPDPEGVRLVYRHASPLQLRRYAVIARIFLENERLPEALTCVNAGLKELPVDPELHYLKAFLKLRKGQLIQCLTLLKKIPGESCFFREAFLMSCLCFWSLGNYHRALQLMETAGEDQDTLREEREFCRLLHHHVAHSGKFPAVLPLLPQSGKSDSLFLDALELSVYLPDRGIFTALVDLAKTREQGKFNLKLAKLFAQKKEEELAVVFFNKALEKGEYDNESLLIMGKIALDQAMFHEARELFRLALENFPQDVNLYLVYARTLVKEAALTLKAGLQQNPDITLEMATSEVQGTLSYLDQLKLDI